jgi:NAD(P) transhydrogenase
MKSSAPNDHLADLRGLPKEIIVVGAGVVGLEYASFMAALGADVTLTDRRENSDCSPMELAM